MDKRTVPAVSRLRPLGLIPLIAFGLLTTLATSGGGGGGGGPASGSRGTLQLFETTFEATEGTIVNIRVTRSGGSFGIASVNYATTDSTALAGSDYTAVSGTLTWADGVSGNRTISIPILDEALEELEESFTLTLSSASGVTLGTDTTVTINIAANDASARLSDLTFSAGALDQIFQSSLTGYTATVSFLVPTTTVTPTTEDPNATVTVDGISVISGQSSGKVTLTEGSTTIEIVVTAADDASSETYTIEVTRETVASFSQQAYIKASNTEAAAILNDVFGSSVALFGDTLAVGAPNEDSAATGINGDQTDNSVSSSGAVYVFTRDGAGIWSQQAYIKASNTAAGWEGFGDAFGASVALSGDTLAVGAPGEDSIATGINGDQSDDSVNNSGAVYVFTRDAAGIWSQQAYIKASNTRPLSDPEGNSAVFGRSLALSDDTLAVGANEGSAANGINGDQDDNSAPSSGAVYLFSRDAAGIWSQQAYIKASNTDEGDGFGWSVALAGDTLAVGAPGEDSAATGINGDQSDNSAPSSGAAYMFTRDAAGIWSQQAYIKASNSDEGDGFGGSTALSGDALAVGAGGEDSAATGINGDHTDNSVSSSGAVYVFTRDAEGVWSQQAYIKSSNTDEGDGFGGGLVDTVALSGDALAVGAGGEDGAATGVNGDPSNNSADGAGAVYVFTRDAAGTWSQQAYVKASNTEARDRFGAPSVRYGSPPVALSSDTLAVGAPYEDSAATGINGDQSDNSAPYAGAVYVFD